MKVIFLCYVFALQLCFSVITGLTEGQYGVCKTTDGRLRCCGEYEQKDDQCIRLSGLIDGPGVCKNGQNMKCCTNYRQENYKCVACEIGTYGDNCTGGPCVYGFFGLGCQSKCNCTSDQYCDSKTGCDFNNTRSDPVNPGAENVHTVVAIAMAVFLSVGSLLVVIVILYNKRLKFLQQYLKRFRTNQIENDNNASPETEEDQEDYSQMTRASNNYNLLSFNRFNVVSRVNVTEEEEIYDQGGAVTPSQTEDVQDSYVSLALRQNHVTPSSNGIKEVICDVEEEVVSDKTYASRDSYITLALNPSTSPKTAGNTKGNTRKGSKQKTRAGCTNKNDQDIYANTLPRFPLNYYVLENDKIGSKGKKEI